jgi:hypothetical protein
MENHQKKKTNKKDTGPYTQEHASAITAHGESSNPRRPEGHKKNKKP